MSNVDEKRSVSPESVDAKHHDVLAEYTPEEVAKAWRKVDLVIMPVASLLYLASYIDRANIGNAKILGMYKALGLSDYQYNLALSIFFVGYVLFETPSNILLKRLRPRFYIPTLTALWGMICALFAVVQSPGALIAIRFFLGVVEGGFLPGVVFWLGSWYPRHVQGRRFAILYSTVSLTGAFGGLLATGIHSLDGAHGIAGWRWIYIVEGVVTAGLGLLAFFVMVDYPVTAKILTPREREIVIRANEADRALKAQEVFDRKLVLSAFTDWRTYVWALVFLSTYIPVYSVILSLPSVVTGLGYSGTTATLMACPPYGLGFIIVLTAGWTADRYGKLYLHYVGSIVVTMIALIVLMSTTNLVARYVMFFFIMFMFIPISIIWAWASSNIAGSNKRAAATGFIFSCGNIGGAIAGQIYRAAWAPRYVQGHGINLACYLVALLAGTALWASYRRDNIQRKAAQGAASDEEGAQDHKVMLGEDLGDLGDRHPSFRYYL